METAKLDLDMKGLKLSYEGSKEFLTEGLVELCEKLSALDLPEHEGVAIPTLSAENDARVKMSTTDMAVKLSSKSGPDLLMAASANLRFMKGQEEFKRSDLLSEMKAAKSFYKQTYSNNLSKYLEGLVKAARLSNPSSDSYALPHAEEGNMRAALGL